MDATRDYHTLSDLSSKVSQKEKDKYHDTTYTWNLKYETNEQIWN